MKTLKSEERLIVAADFKPEADMKFPNIMGATRRAWVWNQVIALAEKLEGTGACLKINSALRACGYDLIDEIHACGLLVFADLKLFDIKETLSIDGMFLRESKPELLTVVCSAGVDSMIALKLELPDTEILGVQVLTNLKEEDTMNMFGCTINDAVLKFAKIAQLGKTDGLISSGKEVAMLKENFGEYLSLNTPAIRPLWAVVKNDDQNQKRTMTPAEAITAGADRIVVGRPITQAKDPYDAVMRTIDEIDSVKK
jgi:orotidine-5'-phosphate decarboxylase